MIKNFYKKENWIAKIYLICTKMQRHVFACEGRIGAIPVGAFAVECANGGDGDKVVKVDFG